MKYFAVLLAVLCCLSINAQTQIGNDIDGAAAGDFCGRSVSLSADGTRVAIGSPFHDGSGTGLGQVRVFDDIGGVWTQVGNSIEGEGNGDRSGWSISLSADGKRLAIGAILNSNKGHVRIYQESGGTWKQLGNDIDGDATGDRFGFSVDISANGARVAIGANYNANNGYNAGHVKIYQEYNNLWTQVGGDIEGELEGDESGRSVSLSINGARVAIGAIYNDGNGISSGHTRIFEESNGQWTQIGSDIDGEDSRDESGWFVSLSSNGRRVAIGSRYNDGNGADAGHTRIFEEIGGSWNQIGNDIEGTSVAGSSGVVSLSANGRRVGIGAPFDSEDASYSGKAVIYEDVAGTWTQLGGDLFGEAADDHFGWSVALSPNGKRLAVGAINNGGNGVNAGHTRVFGGSLIPVEQVSFLNDNSIKITPNPTIGHFMLELETNETTNLQIKMINPLGQIVHNESLERFEGVFLKNYTMDHLQPGMYFIQLTNGLETISRKLVYLRK